MGYQFSVRGWFSVPADSAPLADLASQAYARRPEWAVEKATYLYALLGTSGNHLAFGTEDKWSAYHYLLFLRDLAASAPSGYGIVTISGECHSDRDRMVVCY